MKANLPKTYVDNTETFSILDVTAEETVGMPDY